MPFFRRSSKGEKEPKEPKEALKDEKVEDEDEDIGNVLTTSKDSDPSDDSAKVSEPAVIGPTFDFNAFGDFDNEEELFDDEGDNSAKAFGKLNLTIPEPHRDSTSITPTQTDEDAFEDDGKLLGSKAADKKNPFLEQELYKRKLGSVVPHNYKDLLKPCPKGVVRVIWMHRKDRARINGYSHTERDLCTTKSGPSLKDLDITKMTKERIMISALQTTPQQAKGFAMKEKKNKKKKMKGTSSSATESNLFSQEGNYIICDTCSKIIGSMYHSNKKRKWAISRTNDFATNEATIKDEDDEKKKGAKMKGETEAGCVLYDHRGESGDDGPPHIDAMVKHELTEEEQEQKDEEDEDESTTRMATEGGELFVLQNRYPKRNQKKTTFSSATTYNLAYTYARGGMASCQNFLLEETGQTGSVFEFLHSATDARCYAVFYKYPLSAFHAFSIGLSILT